MSSRTTEADDFLRHTGFLRRLARRLVRDEHDREDLLQEAWTAAFAVPPDAAGPGRQHSVRGWLARVLRNRASNLHRDREHRRQRELGAAHPESAEGPASSAIDSELGVQERVVTAVRELREPYRTAIYMRYFRERAPAEIAAELGVPVATVNTRLGRGRALLRDALTREFGDRDTWVVALLPLCPSPPPPPLPIAGTSGGVLTVGVAGMKLKIALGAATAAIALVTWQVASTRRPAEPAGEVAAAGSTLRLVTPDEPPAVAVSVEPARSLVERAEPPAPVPEAAAPEPEPTLSMRGVVLDVDGRPMPSTRVVFRPGTIAAVTDRAGRFEFGELPGDGEIRTDEPGVTTILAGEVEGDGLADETTVVAAPERAVSVEVLDEDGAPLEGAVVDVALPPDLRTRFDFPLEHSADVRFRGRTDPRGRHVARVPAVAGAALDVERDGYERVRHELDLAALVPDGELELTLVMRSLARRDRTLSGRVVDEIGLGVPDGRVELGTMGTRTDEDGWFHFDLSERDPFESYLGPERWPARLVAVRPGFLPASLEVAVDGNGAPMWPDPIVLQIGDEALAISGRVVDGDGAPLGGMTVFLPSVDLIAGAMTLEGQIRGQSGFFLSERTGDDGRFEFSGLQDRDYDLAAFDEATLARGDVAGVRAGSAGIEIRVDASGRWPVVRGRVVSGDGSPLEGVALTPSMATQEARGTTGLWSTAASLAAVTTGPEGEFVLRDVPRSHVTVRAEHPDIMHQDGLELRTPGARETEDGSLEQVELEVSLRLRFQVVLDDPEEADEFRVLDADGERVTPYEQTATSYLSTDRHPFLTEGRSVHLFVPETAVTFVLYRDGEEVRRTQPKLRWREDNKVR